MKKRPIIIVDDDTDDRDFLNEAWNELAYDNPLLFFNKGEDVLEYLKSEKESPFLILCDVNIPKMDGFQLKEKIKGHPAAHHKSVPFIFWSTSVSEDQIQKAYDLGGHGFFIKETSFPKIKEALVEIVNYWLKCKVPL